MKRTTLCCAALSASTVIALAVLFGCDDSAKKITAITPKFLYAASCGSVPGNNHALRHHALRHALQLDGSISGSISAFSVDATTGALTALAGNPVVSGLDCPEFMAVDPTQKFLYVPDEANDLIHSYSIGTDGALTEVGTAISQCAFQVAVDPSGKFLIAPDFCGTSIDVYSIASNGSLTNSGDGRCFDSCGARGKRSQQQGIRSRTAPLPVICGHWVPSKFILFSES